MWPSGGLSLMMWQPKFGKSLGLGGSFLFAARQAGYTFDTLVCRILDLARARYFGATRPVVEGSREPRGADAAWKARDRIPAGTNY